MTTESRLTTGSRFQLVPMRPRDPDEEGRTASTLELFFDLVFVVAVSIAAVSLHHSLTDGHVLEGILNYGIVFFGIWWAWMNFTWFATSFDTDDWLYRVLTIVQMGGMLVLASGIKPAFEDHNYSVLILAYVVMRLALVAQWVRASRSAGQARRATHISGRRRSPPSLPSRSDAGAAGCRLSGCTSRFSCPSPAGVTELPVEASAAGAPPPLASKAAGTETGSFQLFRHQDKQSWPSSTLPVRSGWAPSTGQGRVIASWRTG
ncbi:low temperature requirement protein A [Streptomyces parvus]|uniref:low temperature requirement protein A n=1 Tax=Streptomyces parvus TaxID=66428 RepID=UPI0036433FA3